MRYRVLITGSRDWADGEAIRFELAGLALQHGSDLTVVHGACPKGADRLADDVAKDLGLHVERHPAEWDRFGKSAGFRRNQVMVLAGADLCLAFIRNGSRGATHTANLADEAGIPVHRFEVAE